MKYIGCLLAFLLAVPVSAAVSPQKTKPKVSKILQDQGVSIGGVAGTAFTLLDVRRTTNSKKKVERLVFDIGDGQGQAIKGLPGYYHAELQKKPHRLILDFSQMPNSLVTAENFSARLKNSMAVKHSAMSLDPFANTLNLTLDLKPNTKVRVFQVAGVKSTSKVVVDLIVE